MLGKFENSKRRVEPILKLMKDETGRVVACIQANNIKELTNAIERLGLLTSRLYSEFAASQNLFRADPSLLTEAMNTLTASQQANLEAQDYFTSQALGSVGEDEDERSIFEVLEEKITLTVSIIAPALLFFISRKKNPVEKYTLQTLGVITAFVGLRRWNSLRL